MAEIKDKIIQIACMQSFVFGLSENGSLYQHDQLQNEWVFVLKTPSIEIEEDTDNE